MNFLEAGTQLISALEALTELLGRARAIYSKWCSLFTHPHESPDTYTTNLLDLLVDIRDNNGEAAIVTRRQRVVVLSEHDSIMRDMVWGEGNLLARYSVQGARRLAVKQEGSKRVVLLGLESQPSKGAVASLMTKRSLRRAFTQRDEYFETLVEHPTKRVAMKVLFPRSRPPTNAHLVTSPPERTVRRVPVRLSRDGRPYLSWRERDPVLFRTYSLRWSW